MPPRVRLALTVSALCAAVLVVVVVVSARSGVDSGVAQTPSKGPQGFYGGVMPAAFPAVNFTLPDQQHREIRLSSFAGRVVAITFVYSTCANTCPLVVQQLRSAIAELPKPIPALAVSVDPKQDTPANVQAFLVKQQVVGELDYLVAGRATLRPIWRQFGIQPQLAVSSSKSDHSVDLVLLDKTGRARVAYGDLSLMDPDAIAADIRTLEAEPEPKVAPRRVDL